MDQQGAMTFTVYKGHGGTYFAHTETMGPVPPGSELWGTFASLGGASHAVQLLNGGWWPTGPLEDIEKMLKQVLKNQEKIMSAISDFGDKMKVHNDKVEAAITGLQGDIQNLTDQIAVLQASSGKITAEDQATLDAIETQAGAIADKLDALDALTPPVLPPTP